MCRTGSIQPRPARRWNNGTFGQPTQPARCSAEDGSPSAHRFQLVDHTGDDAQAAVPELWILGIEPERPQQFGIMLGAAGGEHVEITFSESLGRILVDGVER